jgi:type IV pilus assembly protein PilB
MPILIDAAVQYGGYISLVKFVILLVLFFGWIPLVNWVNSDSKAVRTNVTQWTSIITLAGAAAILVWLLAPVFMIGLLIYFVTVGATIIAYIIHRNAKVTDFERVLTAQHIKSLFVDENKKIAAASKNMSFVTANGNEVPLPTPKTPEAIGFKIVCEVFEDAIWRRADNILFQPGTADYTVVYSIDGVPVKQPPRPKEEMEYFIHYIKLMADLDTDERRKPQKGTFRAVKDSLKVSWEATTAGSTAGEQLRVKRLEAYGLMKIDDMGLNPDQIEAIQPICNSNSGLFIVSGPPTSGTTSTFYALLRNHDPFINNINTLEKNPAAELANITQHSFALSDSGTTTYAKKLQTLLRMGPDIFGIADCEDSQSAALACAAAREGKTVYVTIEAQSVVQCLGKWIKLSGDKNLVAEILIGISNQRLVRKLCPECRQAYQPNQDLLKKLNLSSEKIKVLYRPGEIEYDKRGRPIVCENCQGTGFFGRTGLFETIVLDEKLKETIKEARSLKEIASQFRRSGMLYMQEQSVKKVTEGVTSINEVISKFTITRKATKKRPKK